jgi:uncharacterized membrane protein YkvA (DUF1232 family)
VLSFFVKLKLLWRIRRYLAGLTRLFFDRRVSLALKAAAAVGALLVVSPIDLLSDIPIVGALDDLALLAIIAALFVRLCPQSVVMDHLGAWGSAPPKNVTPKSV